MIPSRVNLDEILPPKAKETLRHLEFFARRAVQGLLHGIHRSKRIGVSTEFDHHKHYLPGDPLKHIDWKVSARHEHYFVKRYTEDTALAVRLIVDRSGSMLMATEQHPSKYLCASRLAASMAYMILNQKDAVGLAVTCAAGTTWLPTGSTATQLVNILRALAGKEAEAEDSLTTTLKALLDRGERRGLVVLFSDLMGEPAPIQRELARLQAQGHEVLVFHLRDPQEEEFPFNRWVEFRDLERQGQKWRLDTITLKRLYREEYEAWRTEWREWSRKSGIHLVSCRTDERMETVLSEYVAYRGARR
jgi:uncharacterized protein (DUF58 family)